MTLTPDIMTWRILIVDDELDNLNLASDFLEFSGARTTKARSGEAALGLIDTFRPNLILLDLGMPRMDGWEVQRRLRARPEVDLVPIIALTALAMNGDAEKVRAAGFDGYVTKPFRVKALLAEILACIHVFAQKQSVSPAKISSAPLELPTALTPNTQVITQLREPETTASNRSEPSPNLMPITNPVITPVPLPPIMEARESS